MHTKIGNTRFREEIKRNMVTSVIDVLQKDGYCVKSNIRYPNRISNALPVKFGNYTPDIFAYRDLSDTVIIEFENCADMLSHKNENKWKALACKPGLDLHIIVPSCCRGKAQIKSRIKNIPVKIHCVNNWKESLEFSLGMSK